MTLRDVLGGYPVGIMILLVGVTYFFGIAQVNGTIDRVIAAAWPVPAPGPAALPFVFFALTGAVAAMGSPQAGLVLAPVGMPIARRSGVDPVLMAIAINAGISAGGLAPTSLFGIVSYGTARQAGIDLSPLTLFAVAVAANLVLVVAAVDAVRAATRPGPERRWDSASRARRQRRRPRDSVRFDWRYVVDPGRDGGPGRQRRRLRPGRDRPDIGVFALRVRRRAGTCSIPRSERSPCRGSTGPRCSWSAASSRSWACCRGWARSICSATAAKQVGTPMVAALVICAVGGLISAFASTTGILAALVPLTLPLVAAGGVAGWALICALGVCASIVDCSPFSTTGATLVASAAEDERPRLTSWLLRWGLAMVVVGPVAMVGLLVFPSSR